MYTYTLHHELTDGTLDTPFYNSRNKRRAVMAARDCAKSAGEDVARVVVIASSTGDWYDGLTVAQFNTRMGA